MKNNDPIFTHDNSQEKNSQDHKNEEINNEIDREYDDYYDKTDRDEEEMQEFNFFLNNRGGCRFFDIIFFLAIISIFAFVWICIYKLPIPEIIKTLFGLDDTQYPTE